MKEPVDHILRPSLPWRLGPTITECGYDASSVKTITRDEYGQREKDLGRQRAAMVTCMTCMQTAKRWESWEQDPRKAIGREVEWETGWVRSDRGELLKDELIAIAQLIAEHKGEFEKLLSDMDAKRKWNEAKAKADARPKVKARSPNW